MNSRFAAAGMALALAVMVSAGCATKVTGVRASKDFKYDDVVKGGMAIVGVFSSFEELSAKDFNRIATNLQLSIQEEREDYPLTPMPEVRNALGKENFQKIGTEYAIDGILGPEALGTLRKALKERFLVVVRIENDEHTAPSWSHLPDRRDARGRVLEKSSIAVERGRTVKVTAHVYDLQLGKSVWNGLVTSSGRSNAKYPIESTNDTQALEMLLRAARGEKLSEREATTAEKYPAPAPPPLYRLLPNAFEAFAKSLPDD